MDYMSTREAAQRWGVTLRYVQKLLTDGRVPGARKYGVAWMIPSDARKPKDPRSAAALTKDRERPCFFPMLYISGGDVNAALRSCKSAEEKTLLLAQLAVFRCQPQKALELALPLYENATEPSVKLGAGFAVALSAMSIGDVQFWVDTISELEALPLPKNRECERELTLAMIKTGMHGEDARPGWLQKGDFCALPPEFFPFARYLYLKNAYLNWKEIELTALAGPLISECHREKSDLAEVYLRVIAAVAYHDLGKNAEAEAHLAAAADIADKSALLSPFVEYWHALSPLMEGCLKETHPELLALAQEYGKPFWQNWAEMYNELWNKPMVSGLSPRELEAARLISRGLTAREVAQRMGISQSSVKKYLNVAYNKLHIENKQELRRLIHP